VLIELVKTIPDILNPGYKKPKTAIKSRPSIFLAQLVRQIV